MVRLRSPGADNHEYPLWDQGGIRYVSARVQQVEEDTGPLAVALLHKARAVEMQAIKTSTGTAKTSVTVGISTGNLLLNIVSNPHSL